MSGIDEEKILNSLGPPNSEKSRRYKALLTSCIPPQDVEKLTSDHVPPPGLIDGSSRDRILLALAAAAKVFAVDVVERALELQEQESVGGALAPGHLSEAWRRMMLEGSVLGVGISAKRVEVIKETAIKALASTAVQK